MGKDIIIQESGEPKTLSSIDKIIMPKVGGGSAEWVLFENLDLMEKTITKNGTYKAEDDNVYGYHKVTVKVPKKGKKKTGKRPQSSGDPNDYSVTVDDDGNLVYKKLPTSINIINPPSKTVYDDNELIKKQGMLVKAYYADGGLWGDVPIGEITLDPDRASSSGSEGDIYSDGNGLNAIKLTYNTFINCGYGDGVFGSQHIGTYNGKPFKFGQIGNNAQGKFIYVTEYDNGIYISGNAKSAGFVYSPWTYPYPPYTEYDYSYEMSGTSSDEYFTRVYTNHSALELNLPVSTSNPINKSYTTLHPAGQKITAKWNRPEDGKTLTDTFNITIAQ